MNNSNERKSIIALIISVVLFGTIGLFVRNINLPSSVIAAVRGGIGGLFLLGFMKIRRIPIEKATVKKNFLWLVLSGILIGFNWITLFESYRYTTVAVSTLCYYMQPIYLTILAPILLKEKTSTRKLICIFPALLGMLLISGVLNKTAETTQLRGVFLALLSGLLYAGVVIVNKKASGVEAYIKTVIQLLTSSVVMIIYTLLTEDVKALAPSGLSIVLLLTISIVHTGICYAAYFGSIEHIPAQTVGILSYIDPIVAVLLSALFLKEPLGIYGIIGALLIIASTMASELKFGKKQ